MILNLGILPLITSLWSSYYGMLLLFNFNMVFVCHGFLLGPTSPAEEHFDGQQKPDADTDRLTDFHNC